MYLLHLFFRVLSVSSSSVGTFEANSSPCHTWSDHALPVTDIHCGCGGMRAHVVTSSLDQTCKVCNAIAMKEIIHSPIVCNFLYFCYRLFQFHFHAQ